MLWWSFGWSHKIVLKSVLVIENAIKSEKLKKITNESPCYTGLVSNEKVTFVERSATNIRAMCIKKDNYYSYVILVIKKLMRL